MPICEYRRNACGKAASLFFRSFSTPVSAVCPSCKSEDVDSTPYQPATRLG